MIGKWLPVSLKMLAGKIQFGISSLMLLMPIFLIYRWAWHLLVLTKRYRDVPKATGVYWFWARTGPRRSKSRYFDGQAWTAWICHFKHILALDDNILFLAIQAGCTIWP